MPLGESARPIPRTAAAHAAFNFSIDNIWEDPSENETQIAWSRAFYDAMTPFLSEGVYLNFASEETPDRVRQSYGPNYERLAALKKRLRPDELLPHEPEHQTDSLMREEPRAA